MYPDRRSPPLLCSQTIRLQLYVPYTLGTKACTLAGQSQRIYILFNFELMLF